MDGIEQIKRTKTSTPDNLKRIFDVYEPLTCKRCNKSFEKKTSFKIHLKAHKYDDHVYDSTRKKTSSDKSKPHTCKVCEKGFTAKKNLLKHLRVIHKDLNEAEKLQIKKTRCPEINCLYTCRKMGDLRSHIEKFHEIKILKDTLHFLSEEGFLKWKKEEEDNSMASYVSFRRKGILKNGMSKKVLLCHRTGHYNPKGKGKHRLKSHGSCKIGGTCPAAMEIMQYPDGQIAVSYYKTHLGHSKDIAHLQLSREDREKLIQRIEQGFSIDAILEDVKESIDPETGKTKRIHLLSRKDIYNIIQNTNKKIKNNSNTAARSLILEVGTKTEDDSNKDWNFTETLTEMGTVKEWPLPLRPQGIANNSMMYDSEVDIDAVLGILHPLEPKENAGTLSNIPSQLYNLFHPVDGALQSTSKPVSLAQNEESKTVTKKKSKCGEKKVWRPGKSDAKNIKSQALISKLEEKMKKLFDFLPKSKYLTPKQYEVVNRKLDSIINVYNSVKMKTKSKKLRVNDVENEKGKVDLPQENEKVVVEGTFGPQNTQQQVHEGHLHAYVDGF